MTRCGACHEDVIVAVSSAGDRLVLDCEPQPDGEWVADYAHDREPQWFARRWQQLLPEARFLRGRPSRYRLHRQECWAEFAVRVKKGATFAVKLCLLCLLLVGCQDRIEPHSRIQFDSVAGPWARAAYIVTDKDTGAQFFVVIDTGIVQLPAKSLEKEKP